MQSVLFWNSWIQPDSGQILYVGPTKSGRFLGHEAHVLLQSIRSLTVKPIVAFLSVNS